MNDDPKTVTYLEVRNMLRKIVCDYRRRNGGNFDELMSEAHLGFVKAYESYDPKRGQFTTHCWWQVMNALKTYSYERVKARRYRLKADAFWDSAAISPEFDLGVKLSEAEGDIQTVAWLALEPTIDIVHGCRLSGETTDVLRYKIYEHLLEQGWTTERVLQAFQDAKEAIA